MATFETQEKQNTEFTCQATSDAHISGNISFATSNPEKCSNTNTKNYNEMFLMKIGVSNTDAFLSEDVRGSKKFMQVLGVLSVAHHEFSILKETYTNMGIWFKSKSKLKDRIIDVEKKGKQVATLCQTARSITITASIGY